MRDATEPECRNRILGAMQDFVEHLDGQNADSYQSNQRLEWPWGRKIVEHLAPLVPRVTVKGNMYPLRAVFGRVGGVNRKLTDEQITSTFEALRRTGVAVSGRGLRAALHRQFGAAGKTDRVFALCRALQAPEVAAVAELRRRLEEAERGRAAAESARDEALGRAVRAEAREMAHQDRWAEEISPCGRGFDSFRAKVSVGSCFSPTCTVWEKHRHDTPMASNPCEWIRAAIDLNELSPMKEWARLQGTASTNCARLFV